MNTIKVGDKLKHFKGKEYEVLALAKHSETLEDMVVYQAQYGEKLIWVRPMSMFFDTKIAEDGSEVPRFSKVEE